MNVIKSSFIDDVIKSNAINSIIDDSCEEVFIRNKLTSLSVAMLKDLSNDKSDWIEYYIFELNFGKKNNVLKVYNKDKNEIPLETFEDLYNIIVSMNQ
jgi:hypothetical protein